MGLFSAEVTRRKLVLTLPRDTTTGHRTKTYVENTIDVIAVPQGASTNILGVGFYAREDIMFLTADVVHVGDQIVHFDGVRHFEAVTVKMHYDILDNFKCREIQAHELPVYEE